MLLYPEETLKQLEKLKRRPKSKADFERLAQRMLEIDSESGVARLILASRAVSQRDLAEADRLAWEALELLPNFYQSYLTLSHILTENGQEDMADRMVHFAVWKIGMSEEITSDMEEVCRNLLDALGEDVDRWDTLTYYALAEAREEATKKDRSMAAVEERVLPFRLLNDLQRQASDEVEAHTVDQILRGSSRCDPIFYNSLRQMVREGEDLDLPFPLMLIAVLGEISGPEKISDLLELADFDDDPISLHACWALWRLGQRYPKEALRTYREAVPAASSVLRLTIAEQLAELPLTEGVTEALVGLLDDFGSRKRDEDAETLLALVANGLIERHEDELARKVLAANTPLLLKKGRAWIRDVFEGDETFESMLLEEEIPKFKIHDICVDRILIDDVDEDLFDEEEDDFFEEPPPPPKPKIGRNEPCWCGSGKKYKKCHLASDEAGTVTVSVSKPTGPVNPDHEIAAKLAHRIINSSDRWHTPDDLARAKREYFQNDPTNVDAGEENGYLQWFAHDFRDSRTNKALVEHIWETDRKAMSPLEILEAWRNSYAGVFEVMRSEKGIGLELRNVASDEIHFVYDVLGSKDATAGEWLLSRLELLDGRWQLVSDGFRVQPGLESWLLKHIRTEAEAAGETPDAYVRRNGNRLYRVLRRKGVGPVQ